MSSQTDKFEARQKKAEEARKKRPQSNQGEDLEEKNTKKPSKKTNDLSEIGNIVDENILTETHQSNTGDTEMADNKEEKVDMEKLIQEWKEKNPDMVKFMEETSPKAGFMFIDGRVSLTGVSLEDFDKWKKYKDNNEGDKKPEAEEPVAANDNKPENVGLEKKEGSKDVPEEEWVKNMETHWKDWCEDRDPKYVYERDTAKLGYAFKYYKTDEDKAASKPAVEVHYENQNDVKIKTSDGKAADFDFWKAFVAGAKKNDQVVNFERMGKVENKSKLYLACILNGVDVKNANPDEMSFEDVFKELNPEEKKIAQEKLGLSENGAKIAKETDEQEKPNEQEKRKEKKKEKKKEAFQNEWNAKEVNIGKDRIIELREMVKNKEKTGFYKSEDQDFEKYQEGKTVERKKMKEFSKSSKDELKTDEERAAAKNSYNQTKEALLNKILEGNKQK